MIQHILEKNIADRDIALMWHGVYLLVTAFMFAGIGAFVCGKSGRSSWSTRATAVFTVLLTLPLLASVADAFHREFQEFWVEFTWIAVFTSLGYILMEKGVGQTAFEAHRVEGHYAEPVFLDIFRPDLLGPPLARLGYGIYDAFIRPRRKEDGYYPDDSNALKAMFSTVSARLGFAKQA